MESMTRFVSIFYCTQKTFASDLLCADAISQLAQTTMRSEIGSMTLDQSLKERAALNAKITLAVNEATEDWGTRVMRCVYGSLNSHPPKRI
jgi:regulator of protease activity HflC (stomatin/prohibitin superfamily)